MKKLSKILAIVMAVAMVLSMSAVAFAAEDDGYVYWLNFKPESDEILQDIAAMYTEETGVPVTVVTAASGTYDQTLLSEMDKSTPPTLYVIGSADSVPKWDDYAYDLTGTPVAEEMNTDAYNLYKADGGLAAIGYCYESFGIIVNPDLVEEAGHSMDELINFDGLKAVAEDIHARADELGFDAFTSNDMDPSSSWRYTGHMINLAYFYEERDGGEVWTTAPESIEGTYVDNFRALYDLCVENSTVARTELATGGHDAEAEFNNGEAAFFVQGSWEWAAIAENVPNATMIPYYCGVEGEEEAGLNNGTGNYWVVNAKADEASIQATLDFMLWCVTNEEASRILVDSFGAMPFTQAAESTNAFLAAAEAYTANGNYVMDWATNYEPNVDDYRATFVSMLNIYNSDPTDANWEQVRSAIVDGWAYQYSVVNG